MGDRKYIMAAYTIALLDMAREPTNEEKEKGFEYYLGKGYYVKAIIRKVQYSSNMKSFVWTIVYNKSDKYGK